MITIANTITISQRDLYLTDYAWEIVDGTPMILDTPRPDYLPRLRRPSMLSNILWDLGIKFRGYNDGNPLNLCRSNLLPVNIRQVKGRWVVLDAYGRRVVSAATCEEAEQARKSYYDD